MRSRFLLLVLALSLSSAAVAPRVARANEPPAAITLAQIDADAPVVLLFRPRAEAEVWSWLARFEGAVKPFIGELMTSYREALGVDPTQRWAAAGIDPETPVAVSVLAMDEAAAEKAYKATADAAPDRKKMAKGPRAWWRTRVVARVLDEAKVRETVARHGMAPDALATRYGAPKQAKAVAAWLKKQKIVAAGELEESVWFARVEGGFLLVDVLTPFHPGGHDWKRDAKEWAKLVARKAPKGGATELLGRGAGRRLADADLAVWIHPERWLDLGRTVGRSNILDALEGGGEPAAIRQQGETEVARCEEFRPIATSGLFEDFVLTLRVKPNGLEASAVWSVRPGAPIAGALATVDDGLVDLSAADAPFMLVLYLKGAAGLRALPRTPVLADVNRMTESTVECGFAAASLVTLFAWPELAALSLDQLAAQGAGWNAFMEKIRNGAIVMRTLALESWWTSSGVMVGSFDSAYLHDWFSEQLGKPSKRTVGQRSVDIWRPQRGSAWGFASKRGGSTLYGIAFGAPESLDWFWGRPSPTPAPGAPSYAALVKMDLPALLAQAGREYRYLAPYFDSIAKRVGPLAGSFGLAGDDLVVGTLKLEIK